MYNNSKMDMSNNKLYNYISQYECDGYDEYDEYISEQVDIKKIIMKDMMRKRKMQRDIEEYVLRENENNSVPEHNYTHNTQNEITKQPTDINIDIQHDDVESHSTEIDDPSINTPEIHEQYGGNTCGPWGSDCITCWYCSCNICCFPVVLLCKNIQSTLRVYSANIVEIITPIYFFILYVFTKEQNTEADVYINYFTIKKKEKVDNVTVFQIIETTCSILFELYKTLIGSFLTVFTSQRCGNNTCTILENFFPKNELELVGLIVNFLMATTLLIEYIFEIMREAYLMKYLKYDNNIANNGDYIASLYESSEKRIFRKLIPLYRIYIQFSYVVLVVYIVNVIISAIIIERNYYDNTSLFGFITNALFIIYKIYNVVEITSYKGNYFYSAYKRKNVHYNTIRPQFMINKNNIIVPNPKMKKYKKYIDKQKYNNGIDSVPKESFRSNYVISREPYTTGISVLDVCNSDDNDYNSEIDLNNISDTNVENISLCIDEP